MKRKPSKIFSDGTFFRKCIKRYTQNNSYIFYQDRWRTKKGNTTRIKVWIHHTLEADILSKIEAECKRFYGNRFIGLYKNGISTHSNGLCVYYRSNKRRQPAKQRREATLIFNLTGI